jgi:hypothetical protein
MAPVRDGSNLREGTDMLGAKTEIEDAVSSEMC